MWLTVLCMVVMHTWPVRCAPSVFAVAVAPLLMHLAANGLVRHGRLVATRIHAVSYDAPFWVMGSWLRLMSQMFLLQMRECAPLAPPQGGCNAQGGPIKSTIASTATPCLP